MHYKGGGVLSASRVRCFENAGHWLHAQQTDQLELEVCVNFSSWLHVSFSLCIPSSKEMSSLHILTEKISSQKHQQMNQFFEAIDKAKNDK
jgi:hypothetical protein